MADVNSINLNNPSVRGDFGKEISMWTVNNYLRNIKVFYTWLYESKMIKSNPVVGIKYYKHSRTPKSEIKYIDFNKLIKCLDLTSFAEYRDYVILQLLMVTGMRIGETLSLEDEHILLDKKAIFILAEINKDRKDRYVFFSTTMQSILKRWMDYKERYFDTEYVFISTRGSNFKVMNFEIRAKINESITCHQIRNNFARRFLLSGGDILILSKYLIIQA